MKMLCPNSIGCPGTDDPVSNFSSEEPDREIFTSINWGWDYTNKPPLSGDWSDPPNGNPGNNGCVVISTTVTNQRDADQCSIVAQIECANGEKSEESATQDCDSTPSNPNPPPSSPPSNPPKGPKLFGNEFQRCVVECPNGDKFSYDIPEGKFVAASKSLANSMARSVACREAEKNRICADSFGGGNPCKVFCVGEEANFQYPATSRDGSQVTFTPTGGDLPAGMTIDENGLVTGTPSNVGDTTILSLDICDSNGNCVKRDLCVQVMDIVQDALDDGNVTIAYTTKLTAAGGYSPYTYDLADGSLPDGLQLFPDGTISGTPTVQGTFGFQASVTDHLGNSCVKPLSITINASGGSNKATAVCPSNASIKVVVPAGTYQPVGPYAGYNQQKLNSLAQVQAVNGLQAAGCPMCNLTVQQSNVGDQASSACPVKVTATGYCCPPNDPNGFYVINGPNSWGFGGWGNYCHFTCGGPSGLYQFFSYPDGQFLWSYFYP